MGLFAMNRRDTLKTLLVAPYAVVADAARSHTAEHTAACQEASGLLVLCIGRAAVWMLRETIWVSSCVEIRPTAWNWCFQSHDSLYRRKRTGRPPRFEDERTNEMQIDPSVRNIALFVSDPWNGQPQIEDTDFPQREVDCNWAHQFAASVSATGIRIHPVILRDKARHVPAEIDRVLSIIERQVGFSSPVLRHEFSTVNEQEIGDKPSNSTIPISASHQFKLAALTLSEFIEATPRH